MKTKSLNFIIPLVVYPFDLMVSVGETSDQWSKAISKRWKPEEIIDDINKRERPTQQGLSYVYTSPSCLAAIIKLSRFDKRSPADHGVLAHEIFHITTFVLAQCGLELNDNSMEAYAYLHGYITQEIYKKL